MNNAPIPFRIPKIVCELIVHTLLDLYVSLTFFQQFKFGKLFFCFQSLLHLLILNTIKMGTLDILKKKCSDNFKIPPYFALLMTRQ